MTIVAAFAAAVKSARGGVALDVEVVPGASRSGFPVGFNEWRKRLEARVTAPPENGEANQELVALVAAYFGLPASAVQVTAGHTARRKTLLVRGLKVEDALAELARDIA